MIIITSISVINLLAHSVVHWGEHLDIDLSMLMEAEKRGTCT